MLRLVRFPTLKHAVTDEVFVVLLRPTMLNKLQKFSFNIVDCIYRLTLGHNLCILALAFVYFLAPGSSEKNVLELLDLCLFVLIIIQSTSFIKYDFIRLDNLKFFKRRK